MLAQGSSLTKLRSAAAQSENQPVLALLRSRASRVTSLPIPPSPDVAGAATGTANLQQVQATRDLVQIARNERSYIENVLLVGLLDGSAGLIEHGKSRLLSLATWSPNGLTSERTAAQANREIYLALAQGLDLLWTGLSPAERNLLGGVIRERVMQGAAALSLLDREPYDSLGLTNLRYITQALMLASGVGSFPEATNLLSRHWDLAVYNLSVWGEDGSFGNSIAYAWYNFNTAVPFAAAVRVVSGVNLYALSPLARMGEQLIAFTAPDWQQPNAFGDESENQKLYEHYSGSTFRLHAQLTRQAADQWYWQARRTNITAPGAASIWQVLLLGVDSSPLPAPVAPKTDDWFSSDVGLAAIHMSIGRSDRTSVFFRSSRFGAYNHSHADQNSLVYVSQGKPLLVNSGYTPYYNSPHHRHIRATRYKNALTFDGGFGQSENLASIGNAPGDPIHSMDTAGELIRAQSVGNRTLVTGDASLAYRALDTARFLWIPQLNSAVRSIAVDKASGVTLIYDWASSSTARQWELNFHSPNAFVVNASTVKAQNGNASVCLDRHGPATSVSQNMNWGVNPEVIQPAQSHARFTSLVRSTEFAHLTVLRESCRNATVQVTQSGTSFSVNVDGKAVAQFDKRFAALN